MNPRCNKKNWFDSVIMRESGWELMLDHCQKVPAMEDYLSVGDQRHFSIKVLTQHWSYAGQRFIYRVPSDIITTGTEAGARGFQLT